MNYSTIHTRREEKKHTLGGRWISNKARGSFLNSVVSRTILCCNEIRHRALNMYKNPYTDYHLAPEFRLQIP